MFCDVLIIGCGPAGSSAAMEASKMGVDTLVVEKKRSIGNPVQCAEFIPKLILNMKLNEEEKKRKEYYESRNI